MNIRDLKKQQYAIPDSYIPLNILYQCREIRPERIIVAEDRNNIIFFEETAGSLKRRHLEKTDKATSYNLLVSDGKNKAEKLTIEWLKGKVLNYKENYNLNFLISFLENNNHRFNALGINGFEKKKHFMMTLTETEHELVKEFVQKLRTYKKVKDNAI